MVSGRILKFVPDQASDIVSKGYVNLVVGRTYRITATVLSNAATADIPDVFTVSLLGLSSSFAVAPVTFSSVATSGLNGSSVTVSLKDGWQSLGLDVTITTGNVAVYGRPRLSVAQNSYLSLVEIESLGIEDVTESTLALNSATTATIARNDAVTARNDAQSAASTATTQATLASTSAVNSSNAANQAIGQIALSLPERTDANGSYFYHGTTASDFGGAPSSKSMATSDVTNYIYNENGYGYVWKPVSGSASNLLTQGTIPATTGKIYEITAEWEVAVYGGSVVTVSAYTLGLDSNYSWISNGGASTQTASSTGVFTHTVRWGQTAPLGGLAWGGAATSIWLRPLFQFTSGTGSTVYLRRTSIRDVTAVVAAENQAGLAQSSATAAATSATTASTQATNASNSATVASNSALTATSALTGTQTAVAAIFPERLDNTTPSFTLSTTGSPTAVTPISSSAYVNASGYGNVYQYLAGSSAGSTSVSTVGTLPYVASRYYKIEWELQVTTFGSGDAITTDAYMAGLDGNYALVGSTTVTPVAIANTTTVTVSAVWGCNIAGGDANITTNGLVYLRPTVRVNHQGKSSVFQFHRIKVTDVTSQTLSAQSASAAATSASNASTSATAAGNSATSAQNSATSASTSATNAGTSATNAQTFAGNAQTYANNASTSASNASGSANTASTQAGVASTSATQASNYATAAGITAATILPNIMGTGLPWTANYTGSPSANFANIYPGSSYTVVSGVGTVWDSGVTTSIQRLVPVGVFNGVANRVIDVEVYARMVTANNISSATCVATIDVEGLNSDYSAGATLNLTAVPSYITSVNQTGTFTWTVFKGRYTIPSSGFYPYYRPRFYCNFANGGTQGNAEYQVAYFNITDVTESVAATAQASAAATSASNASTSATNAGTSATAAQNSATSAATQAGNAQTYANNASTSATNASGSANTATTQAGVASTAAGNASNAATTAQAAAASIFPERLDGTGDNFTYSLAGSPANTAPLPATNASYVTASGYGTVYQVTGIVGSSYIATVQAIPFIQGRSYQIDADVSVTGIAASDSLTVFNAMYPMDANYAVVGSGGVSGSTTTISSTGLRTFTNVFSLNQATTGADVNITTSTAIWLRPYFRLTSTVAGSVVQVRRLKITDVTQSLSAANSASAAATSASTASTQATNAGNSATAAQNSATSAATSATNAGTSATNAQTYSGQAQTYASNASTSASNASGSANTASTQAGVASTSASTATSAAQQAITTAALLLPSRLDATGTYFFDQSFLGDPATKSMSATGISKIVNESGYGYVYSYPQTANATSYLAMLGVVPATSGLVYQIDITWECVTYSSAFSMSVWPIWMDGSYAQVGSNNPVNTSFSSTGTLTKTIRVSNSALSGTSWPSGSQTWPAGTSYIRMLTGITTAGSGSVVYLKSISVRDVTAVAAAENQATLAAGSASAAATSASTASTQATNAGNSATAANTSATNAATSATNAGTSATNANTYAGNAQTYANNASTSATNASGSANTATTQAGVASSSASNAIQTVAQTLPSDFQNDGTFWATSYTGAPTRTSLAASAVYVFPANGSYLTINSVASATTDVSNLGAISVQAGRSYMITANYNVINLGTGGSAATITLFGIYLDNNYNQTTNVSTVQTPVATGVATITRAVDGSTVLASGTNTGAMFRSLFRITSPSGRSGVIIQLNSVVLEDVTESTAATGSATAAANSASTASTQATNAGNSATAASNSATSAATSATNAGTSASNASTYAGNAQTYANNASTSATNAAGSANTATTQAGLSASAATTATNAASTAINAATFTFPIDFSLDGTYFTTTITGQTPTGITPGSFITLPSPAITFSPNPSVFSSQVSFARASTATFLDSTGLITSSTAGTPRLDWYYNGTQMVPGGLLVEPASTNLFTASVVSTLSYNQSSSTIAANAAVSPDGTTTAARITFNGGLNFSNTYTAATSTKIVSSFFIKNETFSGSPTIYVGNGGSTGGRTITLTISGNSITTTDPNSYIVAYPNNWFRVCISYTSSAAITAGNFVFNLNGSTTGKTFLVWGLQAEVAVSSSNIATSYIPTSGSTVARAVDTISDAISTEFNTSGQSAIFKVRFNGALDYNGSGNHFWGWDNGSTNNQIGIYAGGAGVLTMYAVNGGSVSVKGVGLTLVPNTDYKISFGFDAASSTMRCAVNGTSYADWTGVVLPTVALTTRRIGNRGSNNGPIDGWILPYLQGMSEVSRILTAAEMQAITT